MFAYAIAAVLAAAVVAILAAYARELGRFEAFLRNRPATSNARLNVGSPLPGCEGLASAINGQLHDSFRQELRMRQDEEELLEGLAGLSHDIRTPLAGAKGYLQLARDEPDAAERARCMEAAEERLGAMQVMLDQLFDYTRTLAPDALDVCEVDASAVLVQVLDGSRPAFAERGLEVERDLEGEGLRVQADEGALRRVFENVVANMLKHGAGEARVTATGRTICFSNALKEGDPVDADAVFERFYRSDEARSVPGAGLGLPVVRSLCEAMGAEASARVEDGCFALTLELPR